MQDSATSPRADRIPRLLAWASIGLCLVGAFRFLWFVTHAPWGQGGDIGGVALIAGTMASLGFLTICSLVGLILGALALRRIPRTRLPITAVTLNALALGGVLLVILINVWRAAAV